ncbi:MAG: tRNA uridine-5-carboxymethylaminomethyl(34) synthesis GTPase MnmE [Candidatus Omnitrophota bacterium]|nr:tRNA uridine-5-carboxymethylaminomethyl(34) synthesis GTPase MnmE [Candidatus Omnitrophota bacterium]
MINNTSDTIAAIATSVGESGIGIVRLSGQGALSIADKIFLAKDGKKPSEFKTYTVHYGWIVDEPAHPHTGIIDEVLLTVMRAPRSYTKEDVVEINCHGGIVAMRRVLELALENGCRMAGPGEFTKRAFLNGRIDLAQAEAVLDIIRAKTDYALKIGAGQLSGVLSKQINRAREALLEMLSILEANIDFPEEEISVVDLNNISERIGLLKSSLKDILGFSRLGRIIREGISVVICGRPNVGKSSLFNSLLKEERSIVTHIAGTTRDTIEEIIDIKGIPIRIVDSAGILEPRGLIEKKAVWRSRRYAESADLVLLVFDGSRSLSRQDILLMKKLTAKVALAVINKADLKQKIEKDRIASLFKEVIEISARKGKNIHLLEDAIARLIFKGEAAAPEPFLISNLRHIELIRKAQNSLAQAEKSLDNRFSVEFVAQDLKESLAYLDDILGRSFGEDLLERIFNNFCIGK